MSHDFKVIPHIILKKIRLVAGSQRTISSENLSKISAEKVIFSIDLIQ